MNQVTIIPIGSGSTGNCFYLEIGPYHLLIDLGIPFKKVRDALVANQRDLSNVDAVFLTHGHHDHVKAATAVCNHLSCKVYANQAVMYPIRNIALQRVIISCDEDLYLFPDLKVRMFRVPHDYVETCGFTFTYQDRKVGFLTDCGLIYDHILEELYSCDPLIIECNHDLSMLTNGPYPEHLKTRIHSRYGHLSNDQCAETILKLYPTGTRNILLAHLSQHNNTAEIAIKTVKETLNRDDITLYACPMEGNDLLIY